MIDGLTGDQRFFLAYACCHRATMSREMAKANVRSDSHAPSVIRVNGVVRNVDAWYDAFGVEPGSRFISTREAGCRSGDPAPVLGELSLHRSQQRSLTSRARNQDCVPNRAGSIR